MPVFISVSWCLISFLFCFALRIYTAFSLRIYAQGFPSSCYGLARLFSWGFGGLPSRPYFGRRCQNALLAKLSGQQHTGLQVPKCSACYEFASLFFSDLIPAADDPFSLLGLPDPVPGVLICFYLCRLSAFLVSCLRAAPVILVAALCVVS